MHEILRKMAHGAAWMVVARVIDRLIGLLSTIILVRLLVPSDFGLLAMATAIIAMLALLGEFSLDLALIQNSKAERTHYDTAWTINLLFCLAYALGLLLLARPAALFYAEPRLTAVMQWLALGTLLSGFVNVGVVEFRKQLQLHKEFVYLLSKRAVAFVVTIGLALLWRDYWALVAGTLSGTIAALALSYLLQPYRPRISLAAHGELLRFSKWLYINNLIFFLNARLSDFVIGRILGPHSLGVYTVSLEISSIPTSELAAPVNRAVFPGYSRLASDSMSLRAGFLSVISMIALFVFPASAGIAAIAEVAVPIILGHNWALATPLVQILAIYGVCIALQTNTGLLFVAKGRPEILTWLAGTHLAVLVPTMVWLTLRQGAVGAAIAAAACALLFLPINYLVLFRVLSMTLSDLMPMVWRPIVASAAMVCVVKAFEPHLLQPVPTVSKPIALLILIAIGVLTYFTALFLLWSLMKRPNGAEKLLWQQAAQRVRFLA